MFIGAFWLLLVWLFCKELYTLTFSLAAVASLVAGCLLWPGTPHHNTEWKYRMYLSVLFLGLGILLITCLAFHHS